VTPGEVELAQRELALAGEALGDAALLLDAGSSRGGASRMYYGVFHATRAALLVRSRHAKTHAGQVRLFTTTFGDAPVLGRLLGLRAQADYGRETLPASAEQLRLLLADAHELVERCRAIVADATAAGPDEPDPPPDD